MNKPSVVFSDFAGTIIESNPWDAIRNHPDIDKTKMKQVVRRMLPLYGASKIGIMSDAAFRDRWMHGMATVYTGWTKTRVREFFGKIIDESLRPVFHHDVIERLRNHASKGDHVVIVSGMFTDMTQMIAEEIGIHSAVGTQLEYVDGVCTGRLANKSCVGKQKIIFMQNYVQEQGLSDDFSDAFAYADSYSDVPLLASVGNSVATYPDAKLRSYAERNQWEILVPSTK